MMFNRSSAVLIVLCGLLLATAAHAEEGFLVSCDKSILGSKYIGTYKMAISGKLVTRRFDSFCPDVINIY